ncbi:ParB N-terminal domain-containing protein [Streptomyces carpaticus]|uniref:ParB/RepB/Spo0J family partition protein n=1 Tax=Streptomyces TaxID=1883 RepID=UPI0021FA40B7|nr:ParB N-terminal domain-containing protein [Streptomyces carpaticus]
MSPTQSVPIDMLTVGESLRFTGEDVAHVQQLMEVVDDLPPITVHRTTMRVIDGVHRLRAAHLAGRDTVKVTFFEGTEDGAFVKSVEANVQHGLPLSVAERKAAAVRIMASHPDWSNRRIATVAGLSAKTVSDVRSSHHPTTQPGVVRLGRDGRVRPIDASGGRRHASRLLSERPDASLREIARLVGISPETVRDVRDRLTRGEDPVPQGRRDQSAYRSGERPGNRLGARSHPEAGGARSEPGRVMGRISHVPLSPEQKMAIALALRRDPSLRFSESGRLLLRWLEASLAAISEWDRILRAIPSHRKQQIADLAKTCAEDWGRLADQMSSQATRQSGA